MCNKRAVMVPTSLVFFGGVDKGHSMSSYGWKLVLSSGGAAWMCEYAKGKLS